MTFEVNDNVVITSDRIVNNLSGDDASRPSTPVAGTLYFNTTSGVMEVYDGAAWVEPPAGIEGGSVVYAWGYNLYGQLGDDTTTSRRSPVTIVGDITDWVQVSAGNDYSLGLRANGTAYAWGRGDYGNLGDNTNISKSSPVAVVGDITDWVQVSAGDTHSLALRANGTAYAWGYNDRGQLGDDTTVEKSSPVTVVGDITDWVQVSSGSNYSLGLRANGTAYAWGYNAYGNLGDDTTTSKSSPVQVVGGITDWVQVSALGGFHSLGLRANGIAYAWGRNSFGQLGDDTTTSRSSPVTVVGGITDWVQVSSGSSYSLGLRANGIAYAWGSNLYGQLGDDTTTSKSSPVTVVGDITDWVQVSASNATSLALRANGTAYAWGNNSFGQLGDDTTTNKSSPVQVVGDITNWVQVSGNSLAIRNA